MADGEAVVYVHPTTGTAHRTPMCHNPSDPQRALLGEALFDDDVSCCGHCFET